MPDTLDCLMAVAGRLEALRKLKKEADPAGGISLMVRFGVLSDRLEDDERRERREYTGLEACRYYKEIIDLLIKEQEESLNFWVRNAKELRDKLDLAVEKFTPILNKEKP